SYPETRRAPGRPRRPSQEVSLDFASSWMSSLCPSVAPRPYTAMAGHRPFGRATRGSARSCTGACSESGWEKASVPSYWHCSCTGGCTSMRSAAPPLARKEVLVTQTRIATGLAVALLLESVAFATDFLHQASLLSLRSSPVR